ncbi:hypothetical protein RUND412_002253 [Rhizina undulata]
MSLHNPFLRLYCLSFGFNSILLPALPVRPLDVEKAKTALGMGFRYEDTYLTIRARIRNYLDKKNLSGNREQMSEEEWEALVRFALAMRGMEIVAANYPVNIETATEPQKIYKESLDIILLDIMKKKAEGLVNFPVSDEPENTNDIHSNSTSKSSRLPIKISITENLDDYKDYTLEEIKSLVIFETVTMLIAKTIENLKDLIRQYYGAKMAGKSISKLYAFISDDDGTHFSKLELKNDDQVEAWCLISKMKTPLILCANLEAPAAEGEVVTADVSLSLVDEAVNKQLITSREMSSVSNTSAGTENSNEGCTNASDAGKMENVDTGPKRKASGGSWSSNKRRPTDMTSEIPRGDKEAEINYGAEESASIQVENSDAEPINLEK